MSGVPAPVYPIVEPFGADAISPDDITLPIPVAPTANPIDASFSLGFPPITRTDPEEGGQPPYGQDFNGLGYMLSVYCLLMQAGQIVPYNAVASIAFAGYKLGARLASVVTPGLIWTNNLDGNTADPDVDSSAWVASRPLRLATAPPAGTYDNVALPGPSDFVWDVDTAAGAVNFSGFIAQRDGQRIYMSNTGANLLQVLGLNGGSLAARQIRSPGDLALVQNQTLTLQYSTGAGKWLLV